MNIYKEIKKIASLNAKIKNLVNLLDEKYGEDIFEGIDWNSAELVTLSKSEIQDFKRSGNSTDDYFVKQQHGYCEDYFYGSLFFKTDVPGQYVKVFFET